MNSDSPEPFLFLPDVEQFVSSLIDEKSHSEACLQISQIVGAISADDKYTGNQIFLPGLDRLVQRLGMELLNQVSMPTRATVGCPVIVATELYSVGGHTRIIEELVRALDGAIVILSNYFGGWVRPDDVLPTAIGNLPIMVLPKDSAANNIIRLNRLCNSLASHVYHVAHQHDVVANAALSSSMRAPVFFIHHSDHRVSLGTTIETFVHVDLALHMSNICEKYLNGNLEFWPQGVQDKGAKKFSYPLPEISSASSGASRKFAWEGSVSYPAVIRALLSTTISNHYHIGALSKVELGMIERELSDHSISADRFRYVGEVPSLWQCLLDLPINLFIGSAPFHGLRTSIEVQGAGIPFIAFRQPSDGILSEESFYNKMVAYWDSLDQLSDRVAFITERHEMASKSARSHYEESFSPALMKQAIGRATIRYPAI